MRASPNSLLISWTSSDLYPNPQGCAVTQ